MAEACTKLGAASVHPIRVDLSEASDRQELIRVANERLGDINLLVLNAGQTLIKRIDESKDVSEFRNLLEVSALYRYHIYLESETSLWKGQLLFLRRLVHPCASVAQASQRHCGLYQLLGFASAHAIAGCVRLLQMRPQRVCRCAQAGAARENPGKSFDCAQRPACTLICRTGHRNLPRLCGNRNTPSGTRRQREARPRAVPVRRRLCTRNNNCHRKGRKGVPNDMGRILYTTPQVLCSGDCGKPRFG